MTKDNGNVVQSSLPAFFDGDENRDFLDVQLADGSALGQANPCFFTTNAILLQTGISTGCFVWNGHLVAVLPP